MEFSLVCATPADVIRHWLPFGSRPSFFVPGEFARTWVGGVYGFSMTAPEWQWNTQIRLFWYAPPGVIEPFQPGVGVALILDHPEWAVWRAAQSPEALTMAGRSLVHSALEDLYDRFALPSRLH